MLMGETRGLAGEKEFIKCENLSKTFSGEEGVLVLAPSRIWYAEAQARYYGQEG